MDKEKDLLENSIFLLVNILRVNIEDKNLDTIKAVIDENTIADENSDQKTFIKVNYDRKIDYLVIKKKNLRILSILENGKIVEALDSLFREDRKVVKN